MQNLKMKIFKFKKFATFLQLLPIFALKKDSSNWLKPFKINGCGSPH